jgi:hypothetical protein
MFGGMKKYVSMKSIWFIVALITIQSCSLLGIHDPTKRNEKWAWFIDKITGEGKWIPIADRTTVPDGSYILFYHSGKMSEQGKIVNKQKADTIFYFDINEKLIRYSIIKQDTTTHYYVNDGPYLEYLPSGEISKEGIVRNHTLEDEKWRGPFGHYLAVMDVILPTIIDSRTFLKEIATNAQEALQKERHIIPEDSILIIASLLDKLNKSSKEGATNIARVKNFDQMPQLKNIGVEIINHFIKTGNDFAEVVALFKNEITEENRLKIIALVSKLADSSYNLEKEFIDIQQSFQEKFAFKEEQARLLQLRYPEH